MRCGGTTRRGVPPPNRFHAPPSRSRGSERGQVLWATYSLSDRQVSQPSRHGLRRYAGAVRAIAAEKSSRPSRIWAQGRPTRREDRHGGRSITSSSAQVPTGHAALRRLVVSGRPRADHRIAASDPIGCRNEPRAAVRSLRRADVCDFTSRPVEPDDSTIRVDAVDRPRRHGDPPAEDRALGHDQSIGTRFDYDSDATIESANLKAEQPLRMLKHSAGHDPDRIGRRSRRRKTSCVVVSSRGHDVECQGFSYVT
jgi:hypothetical protein